MANFKVGARVRLAQAIEPFGGPPLPLPGAEGVIEEAGDVCAVQFPTYVGVLYADSRKLELLP